jgi:hypothetical protein
MESTGSRRDWLLLCIWHACFQLADYFQVSNTSDLRLDDTKRWTSLFIPQLILNLWRKNFCAKVSEAAGVRK